MKDCGAKDYGAMMREVVRGRGVKDCGAKDYGAKDYGAMMREVVREGVLRITER